MKIVSLDGRRFPHADRAKGLRIAARQVAAIIDLGTASRAFFEKRGRNPRFKRKSDQPSFCAANETGSFRTDGKRIKLPVIGWVGMREEVRFSGPLKRVTVCGDADRWFASTAVATDDVKPLDQPEPVVGVDLNVTNWRKAKRRLACLHARIADIRRDATHKLTTRLAKTFKVIGIEDRNLKGMAVNRHLGRAVMDGGFCEFRRQLDYQTRLYGSRLLVANRWFPSSKTCSCCGVIKATLALSQRIFHCDACGFEAPRDVNAARNLARLTASSAVTACGEPRGRKPRVPRGSAKQEEKTVILEAA
jgi:putative transposase